jgi:hypothetical protein
MLGAMLNLSGVSDAGHSAGSSGPDIGALARVHGVACIQRLVAALDGSDIGASVEAAKVLLAYGHGLPVQPLSFDADGICVEVGTNGESAEPTVGRSNGEAPGV